MRRFISVQLFWGDDWETRQIIGSSNRLVLAFYHQGPYLKCSPGLDHACVSDTPFLVSCSCAMFCTYSSPIPTRHSNTSFSLTSSAAFGTCLGAPFLTLIPYYGGRLRRSVPLPEPRSGTVVISSFFPWHPSSDEYKWRILFAPRSILHVSYSTCLTFTSTHNYTSKTAFMATICDELPRQVQSWISTSGLSCPLSVASVGDAGVSISPLSFRTSQSFRVISPRQCVYEALDGGEVILDTFIHTI